MRMIYTAQHMKITSKMFKNLIHQTRKLHLHVLVYILNLYVQFCVIIIQNQNLTYDPVYCPALACT